MKKKSTLFVMLVFTLLSNINLTAQNTTLNGKPDWVGKKFPNISMPTLGGKEVNTYQFFSQKDNNIIVIGFKCGPDAGLVSQLSDNFNDFDEKYQISLTYALVEAGNSTRPNDENILYKANNEEPLPNILYWFDSYGKDRNQGTQRLGKIVDACPTICIVSKTGEILFWSSGGNLATVGRFLEEANIKKLDNQESLKKKEFSTSGEWDYLKNYLGITEIMQITSDKLGNIYVSGSKTGNKRFIAKIDSEKKWTEIPDINRNVFTIGGISADSKNNLYVAAFVFDKPTLKYLNLVFKWDGSTWSELPQIKAIPDNKGNIKVLLTDQYDHLYASGIFKSFDLDSGRRAYSNFVAKWDGNKWEELKGLTDAFNGISNINFDKFGNLYVLKESSKNNVDKWNGSSWLKNSFNIKTTSSFCVNSMGAIYYINAYSRPGSFDSDYVVKKWNGFEETVVVGASAKEKDEIHLLASDASDYVYLSVYDNEQSRYMLKVFDGKQWKDFSGINGKVKSVAFDSEGNIYAIGYFDKGNGEKSYIASYLRK